MCTDVLMNDYVGRGKETFTYMYKECKHYIQSADQRVFFSGEPSLFSQHLFVVFLGSEISKIDAGSASRGPEQSSAQAEQSAPRSK